MVTGPALNDDDAAGVKALGQMVITGAVAVAGAGSPLLAGAAGAVGVPAALLLDIAVERWRVASQARIECVIAGAVSESGLNDQDFISGSTSSDEQILIVQKAVSIAASSSYEEKLRIVARAWAEAVRDPTKVEESRLKLYSLEGLEAPHVVVLQELASWGSGVVRMNLGSSVSLYTATLDPILQTLHGAGLAYAGTTGGVSMGEFLPAMNDTGPMHAEWRITEWGRQILADLRSTG